MQEGLDASQGVCCWDGWAVQWEEDENEDAWDTHLGLISQSFLKQRPQDGDPGLCQISWVTVRHSTEAKEVLMGGLKVNRSPAPSFFMEGSSLE